MANYYVERIKSKLDWAFPFQRTDAFPLDRTDLFASYEDAVKYAAGDINDPDSRKLCGTSYVGQIITVYADDQVTAYQIQDNRSLKKLGSDDNTANKGVLTIGPYSYDGTADVNVNIYDGTVQD